MLLTSFISKTAKNGEKVKGDFAGRRHRFKGRLLKIIRLLLFEHVLAYEMQRGGLEFSNPSNKSP